MVYNDIHNGIFIRRPNRFIAEVEINGNIEICHVKNTGRCRELLLPGAGVLAERNNNPNRSTKYDLISVYKGKRLINMDSQAPNHTFYEYLKEGRFIENVTLIKAETMYGSSRFDFYIEAGNRKAFIEVKGVTLEEDSVAMFPDAPTTRGVKHLNELARCVSEGYESFVVFVIQMNDIDYFTPNYKTHPEFGMVLAEAIDTGVTALAFSCVVTRESMFIDRHVDIKLSRDWDGKKVYGTAQ